MSDPQVSTENKHKPVIVLQPDWAPTPIPSDPPHLHLLPLIHKSFIEDVDVPEWSQLDRVVGALWPEHRDRLMQLAPSRQYDKAWLQSLENLPWGRKDPLYMLGSLRDLCSAFVADNQYQSKASSAMLGTQSTLIAIMSFYILVLISCSFHSQRRGVCQSP